jgi:hypothetical protein
MDYRSLTSLMLRLAGVFIVVSALTSAPSTILGLLNARIGSQSVSTWPLAAAGFATFAIPFLVGLLLINFPATIANRMVSAGAETADSLVLQQVAFSTLGLYFMTVAAYDAIYWWAKVWFYSAVYAERVNVPGPRHLTEDELAGIISTGAQFVAGMAIMLGGHGIANLLHRLRTQPAGPEPSIQEEPEGQAGR